MIKATKPTHKASSDSQINNEPKAASNVTPIPTVKLNAGGPPIEGDAAGTFTITLDNAAPEGGLTVNYTLAGTATLTADYTVTAGSNVTAVTDSSFTIAAGQTAAVLNINATADSVSDPNESVILKLNAGTDYRLGQWDVTTFSPKVDYTTGSTPFSVISGDFNNDGKLDLAVANASSSTVSVLLRNAANTGFDAKVDYATGSTPTSVSTGDFNNDGKLDLAVANGISNTVSVLLRNAANTGFDAKVDYAVGSIPTSVSTGDFNNDGKLDLAVVNKNSNTVSVLLRNAANTGFAAKVDYAVGTNPFIGNVGDFNNDGKLDLVVANQKSNTVSVLLRNAANTGFAAKIDVATGLYPTSVSTGDFNNDGKLDLAVANQSSNTVSILLRNAKNTGFDAKVDYATGSAPYFVNAGDFNSDGKLDLAVANNKSNTVSVLLRNAANTGFDAKVDYATGSAPYSVNAGDFNNDGKLDLAVVNQSSNTVSALLNNSTPTASLAIADVAVGGKVVTVVRDHAYGNSVVVQADGKILLGGNSSDEDFKSYFTLVRYNSDGSLDTNFDSDGIVITDEKAWYDGNSVVVQANGKILLAGSSHDPMGFYSNAYLVRYNSDGSLDTSFDSDGKIDFQSAYGETRANSLVVQANGKILVGGGNTTDYPSVSFLLVRYNNNGSLDTSFGSGGEVITDVNRNNTLYDGASIAVQADGKILLGGGTGGQNWGDFALVRYNSDGTLDTSFDSDGKVTTNLAGVDNGESLVVQADGKILLGGTAASDYFAVVRYNSNGSLDTSFGETGVGVAFTDVGGGSSSNKAHSVALQADGKILLGGTTTNEVDGDSTSDFALVRYNTDGSLDTSFDGDGIVITDLDLGGYSDEGQSVVVQADGKILLGGSSNGNFALIRYNQDGSLDTSFGKTAPILTSLSPTDNATGIALSANLVLTFNEAIKAGKGTFEIVDALDGSSVNIAVTDASQVSISGNSVTLNPSLDLKPGRGYYLQMAAGVLQNVAGNNIVAGISDETTFNFTTSGVLDTTYPKLVSISPANHTDDADASANIVLTFNEPVKAGKGYFRIVQPAGSDDVITIDVADTSQVSISGNTVTINPSTNLIAGAQYTLYINNGGKENSALNLISYSDDVLTDLAGNSYSDWSNNFSFTWSGYGFTVAKDTVAPSLISLSPTDNATGVAVSSNFVLTFDEAIKPSYGGKFIIYNANGTVAKTIDVNDTSQVTFSDNTVTINPNTDLMSGSSYYINIGAIAIYDFGWSLSANNFAGITGTTAYNFTTAATTAVNKTITGTIGKDTLTGTSADELIYGLAGNDAIYGLDGNDSLIGGLGKDNLTGGLGADKFKFNSELESGVTAQSRDTVVDFNHKQGDKIDLSAIDANLGSKGNNVFTAPPVTDLPFSGVFSKARELYFDQNTSILYGNNDSDSAADFSILLAGVSNLVAADFVL